MRVEPLDGLPELKLVHPEVHEDERGYFLETWHWDRYAEAGIDVVFVQDNHSRSRRGVLRGLHFQHPDGQAKLVRVVRGEIWDVAVDIRGGSPTFGRWFGVRLSSSDHRQLFIPEGFAHGFLVLSEIADVVYKCSAPYRPEHERTLAWNDPELAIAWPLERPDLSARDAAAPSLEALRRAGHLPAWRG